MQNDHYYSISPQSEHRYSSLSFAFRGKSLTFLTDSGVFSRTEIDRGTEVLLNALPEDLYGDVLDMGCGYGVIGLSVASKWPNCNVTLCDINERACELARQNALSAHIEAEVLQGDGYEGVQGRFFDWILQNPPIRAGKSVIYRMFSDAAKCLKPNGSLWLVIRKQQGAPSAINYLKKLFASVEVPEKKSGYWILVCHHAQTWEEKEENAFEL